jgi:hypothetical protein
MDREELVDALVDAFRARAGVVDVRLDGSLGRGGGDGLSDVDLEVTVDAEHVATVARDVPVVVGAVCDPVLVRALPFVTLVVTREWHRIDVAVRAANRPPFAGPDDGEAGRQVVEEFLRCLGLLPVARARRESIGSVLGVAGMVGLLTDLMQIENGTRRFGGALRLSERLTPEQRAVIAALPPLRADGDALVDVQVALARDFLPRARRVAAAIGFEYPDALETALFDHLRRHGIEGFS